MNTWGCPEWTKPEKQVSENPSFCEKYTVFVSDTLTKGYAAKVPDDDLNRDG